MKEVGPLDVGGTQKIIGGSTGRSRTGGGVGEHAVAPKVGDERA